MEQINILVQSGEYCRLFTSKTSFSIRNIITQLRRYNPIAKVIAVWYGDETPEYANNQIWTILPYNYQQPYFNRIDTSEEKPEYLQKYAYRSAVNMWYCQCLNNGKYPGLHPFSGVKRNGVLPPLLSKFSEEHYPLFVQDKDNPFIAKEDILSHLDGYRVERMINGYEVAGYVIDNNRYSTNGNDRM